MYLKNKEFYSLLFILFCVKTGKYKRNIRQFKLTGEEKEKIKNAIEILEKYFSGEKLYENFSTVKKEELNIIEFISLEEIVDILRGRSNEFRNSEFIAEINNEADLLHYKKINELLIKLKLSKTGFKMKINFGSIQKRNLPKEKYFK